MHEVETSGLDYERDTRKNVLRREVFYMVWIVRWYR